MYDVQIGTKHKLKCALVFETVEDLEGIQDEAWNCFMNVDLCSNFMLLQPWEYCGDQASMHDQTYCEGAY